MKIQNAIAIALSAALTGMTGVVRADEAFALTHEILTMDAAASNKGSSTVTTKIAADFQTFAGSRQNATELVTGLREGSEITLTQRGHRSATFTPPTGKMGYGNVSTSLALAQHQLAQQGITNPTPLQLKAALNGGTIFVHSKPVTYDGVLQMRADGLGWGQIAQQLGTKLGPVVSGIKAQNTAIVTPHPIPHPTPLPTPLPTPHATTVKGASSTSTVSTATNARGNSTHAEGKGIVDAGGGAAAVPGKGKSNANISSAAGRPAQPGRGIVSAGGQTVGTGATGAGNAHGNNSPVTASGAAAGNSAGGGSQGQGKALGHTK